MVEFIPPTPEETRSVQLLKSQLQDANVEHHFTDVNVLRFLRGRKHDVVKALRGLTKHAEWRAAFRVDHILTDTSSFQNEMDQNKGVLGSYDRHGRPILYIIVRRHRSDSRDINQLRSYIIYSLQKCVEAAKPEEEMITITNILSK